MDKEVIVFVYPPKRTIKAWVIPTLCGFLFGSLMVYIIMANFIINNF